MRRLLLFICLISVLIIHSSCGNEAKTELDYDETKQMMIDILQTTEGKKALLDILSDDELKQYLIIDTTEVKQTISETLMSKDGQAMWERLFADPEFVGQFHTSIADEQAKMLKQLMKDADFQKQMMTLLQNPEMEEETIKLLKSQSFQEHLEKVIVETINNPLYRSKLHKELNEKIQEEEKDQEEEEDEKDINNSPDQEEKKSE